MFLLAETTMGWDVTLIMWMTSGGSRQVPTPQKKRCNTDNDIAYVIRTWYY